MRSSMATKENKMEDFLMRRFTSISSVKGIYPFGFSNVASYPGLRGEERPGTYCMRMFIQFRIFTVNCLLHVREPRG